jgi:hypothetical protein
VVVKEQLVNVRHPCLKAVQAAQAQVMKQDWHYNLPAQVVGLVMQVVLENGNVELEGEEAEQQLLAKVLMAETADLEQLLLLLVLRLPFP